jgi:hypothetical protein
VFTEKLKKERKFIKGSGAKKFNIEGSVQREMRWVGKMAVVWF